MARYKVPIPDPSDLANEPHRWAMFWLDAWTARDFELCTKIYNSWVGWLNQKSLPPTERSYQGSWNHCAASFAAVMELQRRGQRDTDAEKLLAEFCQGQLTGDLGWWGKEFFSPTYDLMLSVYAAMHDWAVEGGLKFIVDQFGREELLSSGFSVSYDVRCWAHTYGLAVLLKAL